MIRFFPFFVVCALGISGCGSDVECEPGPDFHKLFQDGGQPSNKEAMDHMVCTDSEGNIIE